MNDEGNSVAAVTKRSRLAKWSLALAIISLPIGGQESSVKLLVVPVAIAAIAMGIMGLVKIRASSGALKGKGLAVAGIILAVLTGTSPLLFSLLTKMTMQARLTLLESSINKSGATTLLFSPELRIHCMKGATETDARDVGAAITQLGLLRADKRNDVLVSKDSAGLTVSVVVFSHSLKDAEKAVLPQIAEALATELNIPVQLRVVDFELKELGSAKSRQ